MMGVEVFPALLELMWLMTLVVGVVAGALAFVWFNFKVWSMPLYVPIMMLIGMSLSLGVFVAGGDPVAMTFVGGIPFMVALIFRYMFKGKYQPVAYFIAPAGIGILLLFLYPLLFEFYLSFHDLSLGTFSNWIETGDIPLASQFGFGNYTEVFQNRATGQAFHIVLMRTISWTFINVVFHVGLGLLLALLLNQKGLKGLGIYRAVLTLPWVIPQVIAVLVWKADFNESVGFVNQFIHVVNQLISWEWNGAIIAPLTWIGFKSQSWFLDPDSLFVAACIVNIWLGVPFMMINSLGALQSIPKSVYEAASIDGATRWQQFKNLTLPLLKPVMVPAALLGGIWTFNNLNVIFLMTDGGRYEGADILVTDLYKQSFTYYRYGFAAAYSFVIFAILIVLSILQMRISRFSEQAGR